MQITSPLLARTFAWAQLCAVVLQQATASPNSLPSSGYGWLAIAASVLTLAAIYYATDEKSKGA